MRRLSVMHSVQVFVTAQGRCLELAKCLVQGSGVLVIVSPGSGAALAARLNKYVLYGDEVSRVAQDLPHKDSSITMFVSCPYGGVPGGARHCAGALLQNVTLAVLLKRLL